jgi:hypothetical protein
LGDTPVSLYIQFSMSATMSRNRIAFFASLTTLSAAMVIWGDLFRWSKVAHLPAWAEVIPAPLMFPSYLALVCLLPAALGTDSVASARAAVLKSVLLAPFAAVIAFALNPLHQNTSLVFNALFHYVWIVLFFCALPAILVVFIRAVIAAAFKRPNG